jgi:triphosphoribosyl-dephospho-CoA synthase
MDAALFEASATSLGPYMFDLVQAGERGARFSALQRIGLAAEAAMLKATRGINTHRGAIFGLGLLCAAAGQRGTESVQERRRERTRERLRGRVRGMTLGAIVAREWGHDIAVLPGMINGHGDRARQRHGAGGARAEAANGFPSLYQTGLRALHDGIALSAPNGRIPTEAARVHCCFELIATVVDTNLLHRGGIEGLRFAQRQARDFIADGGVGHPEWPRHAERTHNAFVARRLSPGGSADLLAMSLFVAAFDRPYGDRSDAGRAMHAYSGAVEG